MHKEVAYSSTAKQAVYQRKGAGLLPVGGSPLTGLLGRLAGGACDSVQVKAAERIQHTQDEPHRPEIC